MFKRLFLIFPAIFITATIIHSQSVTDYNAAAEIAQKVYETRQLPGMVISIAKGHEWQWTETYGFANIEDSVRIDPDKSLFRIGSVSKTLTAAGLMQLYDQGKIDLDAEIQKYVSEFPEKKYDVSVRQIAQHVGGIRHYEGMEFLNNVHYNTVRDGLRIFVNDTLLYEPGSRYSYSSYGWNLISAAMETASGTEFLDFMYDNVFVPCGMTSTIPDDVTSEVPDKVAFYEQGEKLSVPVDNSYKWAGGGFLSTSADLVRFAQAILDNTLITEESLGVALETYTLQNGVQTTRGIGFEVDIDKNGRQWIGHGGGSIGGTTMLLIYPEQELIVVTIVNQSNGGIRDLTFSIAELFLTD